MPVYGKACGFPQTLEIETTDFHIPSAPATIANIDIQKPKGAFPSLPTVLLQAHPSIGKDCPRGGGASLEAMTHVIVPNALLT